MSDFRKFNRCMKEIDSNKNKINLNRNNLENHKTKVEKHIMSKEGFENSFKENLSEIENLLLNENSVFETAGELDLDNYIDWLKND